MIAGLELGPFFLIFSRVGWLFILIQAGQTLNDVAAGRAILQAESTNAFLMAGLYAITFLSIAMAALLGADTLAGEINSGTIQTIVTKPIRRAGVVLGKWLGFFGFVGLYL